MLTHMNLFFLANIHTHLYHASSTWNPSNHRHSTVDLGPIHLFPLSPRPRIFRWDLVRSRIWSSPISLFIYLRFFFFFFVIGTLFSNWCLWFEQNIWFRPIAAEKFSFPHMRESISFQTCNGGKLEASISFLETLSITNSLPDFRVILIDPGKYSHTLWYFTMIGEGQKGSLTP